MAIHIEFRNGTAAAWTSANPVLSQGEPGVETDTQLFKIGDGTTTWNSLSYQGSAGGTQTNAFRSFGDGSDGNVTISFGTTTLTRDMYYNNLTMSGTGVIVTNGYKIFVKSKLDLTAAQAGAIQWNGNAGGSGSLSVAGVAPSTQPGGTVGDIMIGGTGAAGTTAVGVNGTVGPVVTGNGGLGGAGGRGGSGVSGNGSAATNQRNPSNINFVRSSRMNFLYGNLLVSGGAGGPEGSAGSGDSFFSIVGGGSGSGGNGGGVVAIFANIIVKGANTPAGVIQAKGGNGGNGGNGTATLGGTGGGGGAGGGGGGWIFLCYNFKFGPTITSLLDASGGNGGNGGNGFGTGTGGTAGDAGTGGRITTINIPTGLSVSTLGNQSSTADSAMTGTPAFGVMLSGGEGGTNGFSRLDF